jgi:hypothetical protein
MVEFEADDALAAAAATAARDARVERVIVCTPHKDLVQCYGCQRGARLRDPLVVTVGKPLRNFEIGLEAEGAGGHVPSAVLPCERRM